MDEFVVNRDEGTIKAYIAVCDTFLKGVVRLVDAESAFCAVMHALTTYHSSVREREWGDQAVAKVFKEFDLVSIEKFWAAQYVDAISTLVYSASLFDTFLNETTIFLFLLLPAAMGKAYKVPLHSLIQGQSRSAILTEVAKQRAREISYLSFKDRIDFLKNTFGLPIALTEKTVEALEFFANRRNLAVHDQGFITLTLGDCGQIGHSARASSEFPSDIMPSDSLKAEKTFRFVALMVMRDVFAHILKTDQKVIPDYMVRFMDKILSAPPPELEKMMGSESPV